MIRKENNMKIVVIGTGYVGLPAALMWAKHGQTVVGVDINENVVRALNDGTMMLREKELQDLLEDPTVKKNLLASTTPSEGDVFVIAVPTPVDELKKTCDITAVASAVQAITPYLRPGNLVVVESTIPPMTCRTVVKPLIEKATGYSVPDEIRVAHCPERILPGNIFHEIVHNERLIGGMNEATVDAAIELYEVFVKGELHRTDDITAELSKLMENTYRDVNIALANELAEICENLKVDPRKAIGFANRHPRVQIMNPGIGVGGHCIPVDPWFLKEVAPYTSNLISTARLINDGMPARIAGKIRQKVAGISDPKIVALGATYKKNCEDMRESPAVEIVECLQKDGYRVEHFDPMIPNMDYSSIVEAVRDADLIAVLVCHDTIAESLRQNDNAIKLAMRTAQCVFYDDNVLAHVGIQRRAA